MTFVDKAGEAVHLCDYPYKTSYVVEGNPNITPGDILKNTETCRDYTVIKSEPLHSNFFNVILAEV